VAPVRECARAQAAAWTLTAGGADKAICCGAPSPLRGQSPGGLHGGGNKR